MDAVIAEVWMNTELRKWAVEQAIKRIGFGEDGDLIVKIARQIEDYVESKPPPETKLEHRDKLALWVQSSRRNVRNCGPGTQEAIKASLIKFGLIDP